MSTIDAAHAGFNQHTSHTTTTTNHSESESVVPTPDELNAREEFTRSWVQKYVTHSSEEKRKQLRGILRDPNRSDENVIMRLQLDYEIESNFTLLALILSYYIAKDHDDSFMSYRWSPVQVELNKMYKVDQAIARDPNRSGFTCSIINNLKRFGYSCVASTFDLYNLPPSVDFGVWSDSADATSDTKGNIVSLIYQVLESGRFHEPENEVLTSQEKNYIQWVENLFHAMLEQPTLTKVKTQLLNQPSRLKPRWKLRPILDSLIHDLSSNFYLSIIRYLIVQGAHITIQSLMEAITRENPQMLLELLLSHTNLMLLDLHAPVPLLVDGREPTTTALLSFSQQAEHETGTIRRKYLKYSTPLKLSKRIIEKIDQWQEEQRKQLALDPTFQPNETEIRDWLRQQLSTLPQQLFTPNLHYCIGWCHRQVDADGCRREYIRRWIHQLRTAPQDIRLFEMSRGRDTHFLNGSLNFDYFVDQEFRDSIPLLLTLFDESHLPLVDVPLLWSTSTNNRSVWEMLTESLIRTDQLTDVSTEERAARRAILIQIFQVTVKRFNQMNQVVQDGHHRQPDFPRSQLRSHYSDMADDAADLSQAITFLECEQSEINDSLPHLMRRLINNMNNNNHFDLDRQKLCQTHCSIEVFQELWLNVFPQLIFFRMNEVECRCEFLEVLIQLMDTKLTWRGEEITDVRHSKNHPLKRIQQFLSHPVFLNSDLFVPFQLFPEGQHNHQFEGQTIRQVAKKVLTQMRCYGSATVPCPHPNRKPFLAFLKELESRIWPSIRRDLDDHLIPDLSNIVLTFLQPNSHQPTHTEANADTTSASSTPAFSFQFAPSSSTSSFRPLDETYTAPIFQPTTQTTNIFANASTIISTMPTPSPEPVSTFTPAPTPFTFSFAALSSTKTSTSTMTKTAPIATPLPLPATTTITSPFTNTIPFNSTLPTTDDSTGGTTNNSSAAAISTIPRRSSFSTPMTGSVTATTSTPSTVSPSPFKFSFLSQPPQTNNIINTSATTPTSSTPMTTTVSSAAAPFTFSFATLNPAKIPTPNSSVSISTISTTTADTTHTTTTTPSTITTATAVPSTFNFSFLSQK